MSMPKYTIMSKILIKTPKYHNFMLHNIVLFLIILQSVCLQFAFWHGICYCIFLVGSKTVFESTECFFSWESKSSKLHKLSVGGRGGRGVVGSSRRIHKNYLLILGLLTIVVICFFRRPTFTQFSNMRSSIECWQKHWKILKYLFSKGEKT